MDSMLTRVDELALMHGMVDRHCSYLVHGSALCGHQYGVVLLVGKYRIRPPIVPSYHAHPSLIGLESLNTPALVA